MAKNKTTSRLAFSCVAAVLMSACAGSAKNEAPGPGAQNTGLNPQAARITDERILGDRDTIERVQQRLRKLNEAGIPQGNYPLAKAQCWLDTAKTQYHENDRTGYVEEALVESDKIAKALEGNRNAQAGFDTPHIARSTVLRKDLWDQLTSWRNKSESLPCNARTLACAEVRLVRAGHAEEQTGWRQATPHVQMVEDALRRAAIEAESCKPAPARVVAAAPAPAPAPAPAVVIERETYVILADSLFRFDRSGRDEIVSGGREKIAEIARRLRSYKTIESLTVTGHTDRFGSDAYNDDLSARRASTVANLLAQAGVQAGKTAAEGRGKREPITTTCPANMPREKAISCLQPDRRVTIEVRGVIR